MVMVSSVRARRSSLAGVSFPLTHSRVSCLCDRRAAPNDLRDGALGLIRPASRSRTRSSAGEHLVDIEGVTGSIPVASTTQSFRKISGLQVGRRTPTFPRLARTGDATGALQVGGTGPILPILHPHSPAPFQKWAFQSGRLAGGSNSLRAGKSAVNSSPASQIASRSAPAVPVRVKGSWRDVAEIPAFPSGNSNCRAGRPGR